MFILLSVVPSINLNIPNSNLKNSQLNRCNILTNQVAKANTEKSKIIILTDDNVNSIDDFSMTNYYSNIELKNLRDNLIINNSLITQNTEPTFFRNTIRTCIDHIYSNCPTKITNVRTHVNNNEHSYTNSSSNIINNHNPI